MSEPLTREQIEELQKATAARWDTLPPVHPAALLFPMMGDAEIDEMAADIKKNGLREPIVFWTDNREAKNGANGPFPLFLLDGRNRVEALRRLGVTAIRPNSGFAKSAYLTREVHAIKQPAFLTFGGGAGLQKGKWETDVDPWDYVMSANAHRRHLTPEQKREAIARYIKERPQTSNRKVAKALKVDDKTVAKVRKETGSNAEVPQMSQEHLPIERAKAAVRANPGVSANEIAKMADVGRATAQRALKTAYLAPSPTIAKPSEPKTEPPPVPPKPEPKEPSEEPLRKPSIEAMSHEDIRKWVKELWKDYGRKRLSPGKLSPGSFKNLVTHVLFKVSTPPVRKAVVEIMNAEVGL